MQSKLLLEHLLLERKVRRLPARVIAAVRKWAFIEYSEPDEKLFLTDKELKLIEEHPEAVNYARCEVEGFLAAQNPVLGKLYLYLIRCQEERGRTFEMGPWFLHLPEKELALRGKPAPEEVEVESDLGQGTDTVACER